MKLFMLAVAAWFAWLVHVSDWQWVYAIEYDVESKQVTIEKKPHDCEWSAAPMGEKNCHYERVITTVLTRPAGRGQMVSNDNWKTSYFDGLAFGPISPSVTVSWSKVND